jgi:hypothetical protein
MPPNLGFKQVGNADVDGHLQASPSIASPCRRGTPSAAITGVLLRLRQWSEGREHDAQPLPKSTRDHLKLLPYPDAAHHRAGSTSRTGR